MRKAPGLVAEMPFPEACRRIAAASQQLAERDLPGNETLRQSGRDGLQRSGPDGMAPRHQGRPGRDTITFDIEVEAPQSLGGEPVDMRRGRSAENAAAVAAEFSPSQIVRENENDIWLRGHGDYDLAPGAWHDCRCIPRGALA